MSSSVKSSGSLVLDMVLKVEGDQQEAFLQHGMTIGRAISNTIRIDSPDVEHIHARVLRDKDGGLCLRAETATAHILLIDGNVTQQIELVDQVRFRIGSATLVCIKQQTHAAVDVVVTDNAWRVQCPVCHVNIVQLSTHESACPKCASPLVYFRSEERKFDGWLPRQVGPYVIRAFVGQGGMGVVLRGLHREHDIPAAVKLLRFGDDPAQVKRFMQETETLRKLTHPNIVTLRDHGQDGVMPWLAMEWIDGQALTDTISRVLKDPESVPLSETVDILSQTARGLQYLHDNGVVHRDLKPQNILRARDNLIKIVDFGLAFQSDTADLSSTMLTNTGTVPGTAGYMSPEQLAGEKATPASDVFCFGLIAYELLTGTRPVGIIDTASPRFASLPKELVRLITSCLNTNPRLRPSAREIIARIERAVALRSWPPEDDPRPESSSLPPQPPIRPRPPVKTPGGKRYGCLTYFLLVCGLGIILFGIDKIWGESSPLPTLVMIVGTSIWATIDAVRLKTHKYKGYNGPVAICVACLVFWPFVFPYYLIQRQGIVNGTAKYNPKKGGGVVDAISMIFLCLILFALSWAIFSDHGTEETSNTLNSSSTRTPGQTSSNMTRPKSNAISRDFSFVQDEDERTEMQLVYNYVVTSHVTLMRASAECVRVFRGESDRFTQQEIVTITQNIEKMELGSNPFVHVAELDNAGVPQLPGHVLEEISDMQYKFLELAYYRIRDDGQEAHDAWLERWAEENDTKQYALAMEFYNAPQSMAAEEYIVRSIALFREGLRR